MSVLNESLFSSIIDKPTHFSYKVHQGFKPKIMPTFLDNFKRDFTLKLSKFHGQSL